MSSPKLVSKLERGSKESQNQRHARVERLWAKLDPSESGELDLESLKTGFHQMDHPMKNADSLIEKILEEVDTNSDGKIQYEEFRAFVERADHQLQQLFSSIDKDGNGKVDLNELQSAFRNAGLVVSEKRLGDFFKYMDHNQDGYITFGEWRDFLLFMPVHEHGSQLRAMLSFYDSVTHVTSEGDSIVSEDSLGGLDTPPLVAVSMGLPNDLEMVESSPSRQLAPIHPAACPLLNATSPQQQALAVATAIPKDVAIGTTAEQAAPTDSKSKKEFTLTQFVPDPGYFLAGAIAGGVSRTATAPLDRLKVYLLVNTASNTVDRTMEARQQGKFVTALTKATQPIKYAVRELFRSGGIRGFFAGNGLNVAKIMPETAIKFGSYEAAKRAFANVEGHGDVKQISSYSKFTAGGVAGMAAQFCVYPLDTLKFRLQCETVKGGLTGSALVRQTAMRMYADGGIRSAYRGVTMGLVGMFPYSAIDMGMFELLKKTYRTAYAKYTGCQEEEADPGNIVTGFIGATSGAIGASIVYPLNVVRTRLQTQGTVMHPATYTGIWDVTRKTIKREGYKGLYKGLTPNLLKVAPALSITWVVYENSKRLLGLS